MLDRSIEQKTEYKTLRVKGSACASITCLTVQPQDRKPLLSLTGERGFLYLKANISVLGSVINEKNLSQKRPSIEVNYFEVT